MTALKLVPVWASMIYYDIQVAVSDADNIYTWQSLSDLQPW